MKKIHQTLQLQHRRHTGKLLHHRHTSYRGLAILFGLAGLAMVGLSVMARVTADSLYVYARNPAPIPTSPAVITDPTGNTITKTNTITISGNCPPVNPRVIVTITDNGHAAGSAGCAADNTFSVPITLTPGDHTIIALTTTITDDAGPSSDPIYIHYIAPATNTSPNQQSGPSNNSTTTTQQALPGSGIIINADRNFLIYGPSKDAVWTGNFTGGTPPYRVKIDWGDGTNDSYSVGSGQQSFRHHYSSAQYYDITMHVTDSTKTMTTIEHFAAVTPYIPPAIATTTTPGSPVEGSPLLSLYGAYLLGLAVFGFMWVRAHPFTYTKVPLAHTPQATSRPAAGRRKHRTSERR